MPMKRRDFMRISGGAALLSTSAARLRASLAPGAAASAGSAIPPRVISRTPPLRWEDAMISGIGRARPAKRMCGGWRRRSHCLDRKGRG